MKLTCPHCGEKNIDGTVCPACGQSLGGGKSARRAREYDSYAVGRRVLRLAPVWLLLMAAAVLLFFSWVSRRGASEGEAFRNEATNQTQPAATPEAAHAAASPLKTGPTATATPAALAGAKDESGFYSVQVGAFAELSQANEQVSRMRAAGFEARVVEAPAATRFRFQVRSGLYARREEAARLASELRARGVAGETVIVEPEQNRER